MAARNDDRLTIESDSTLTSINGDPFSSTSPNLHAARWPQMCRTRPKNSPPTRSSAAAVLPERSSPTTARGRIVAQAVRRANLAVPPRQGLSGIWCVRPFFVIGRRTFRRRRRRIGVLVARHLCWHTSLAGLVGSSQVQAAKGCGSIASAATDRASITLIHRLDDEFDLRARL